jgi:tetratricopeptide (TPR) repeat protein
VAARAALERAMHYASADAEMRQQFEMVFGERSRLPVAAKKKYTFRATGKPLPPGADSGKLSDAKKALEAIVAQFPQDAAAHFNLGLLRAWLGENGPAVTSLNASLECETDDFRAEETGALIQVLLSSPGSVEESDFQNHVVLLPIRDGDAVIGLLQSWESQGKIIGTQVDQQNGVLSCMVVEALPNLLDTGTTLGKVIAGLTLAQGIIRLDHSSKESVNRVAQEIRDALTLAVGEPMPHLEPLDFSDVVLEAVAYPIRGANGEEVEKKMSAYAENYMQNTLPGRTFKALGGVSPLDAVGSKLLRKKLLGLLRFLEDCFTVSAPKKRDGEKIVEIVKFDFDGLRHRIGLERNAAAEAPTALPAVEKKDFSGMSAADLGTLDRASLSTAELEEAMKAAIRLQAHELAVAFAQAGADRPIDIEKPDRYPFYACMMTGAVALGKPDEALKALKDGRVWDDAHNHGTRANEYGLRTAALLAKLGRHDESVEAFDEVIARNASDGNLYVKAAETMLSAKSGAKARYFAEKGLAKAKSMGNRDLQGACEELLAAAKKAM